MTGSSGKRIYVALVHHPVVDKNGATIASAVTNLDLHDIARVCRTYDVNRYYIITPLEDQAQLVTRIVSHWTTGMGGTYNPTRRQALERIRIKTSYAQAVAEIAKAHEIAPKTVVTSAKRYDDGLSYDAMRKILLRQEPVILTFGTAWGLTDDFMADADYRLTPITGAGTYNHLSVRSAVSIVLDRLLSKKQ